MQVIRPIDHLGYGTSFKQFYSFPFFSTSFHSDGGGRSGVFMAIDANMELVEEDGLVDIFGYMKKLRQARRGLVETMVIFPPTNNVGLFTINK